MVVTEASAQSDDDRAAARAMATQAVAQEEAGHWSEAIDLLQRAESLVHAPPHLLHIARAEAKLGRLVAARETYLKITREELASGAPRAFVDAHAEARKELADLEPRIPTLKVVVSGGQAPVTIDGTRMSDALIGVERPINPGRHELRATGKGMASKLVVANVGESAHEVVQLVLEPTSGHPTAPAESGAPASPASSPSPTDEPRTGGSRALAYASWGVGAAGLAFGAAMMFVNRGKRDDADAICQGGPCPASRRSAVESLDADANQAATLSWVGLGVGVVGLAAGTVLFIVRGGTSATETQHTAGDFSVNVDATGLRGRF
jgi:hypothetical protein